MRKKGSGYDANKTYAGYGLTRDRVKRLLQECREGKHTDLLRTAAQRAEPGVAEWVILSVAQGKSFHDMEIRWELGETEIMPCCRNSFYSYRKLTLAILDRMLHGEGAV